MTVTAFVWCEGDRDAGDGWRRADSPHFRPTRSGIQVAHDCLEHIPGGIRHGQIADELMALGARLYIRVASGWWDRQPDALSVPEQFGLELCYLIEAIAKGADEPSMLAQPALPDVQAEQHIAAALARAAELADHYGGKHWLDPCVLKPVFAAWLRRGWYACIKRYRNRPPGDVLGAVESLARVFDRSASHLDGDAGLLQVAVDERSLEFEVRTRRVTDALLRRAGLAL